MGEVYRARDVKLGRDVAIKILSSAFTSDADRLARFEREARVLGAVQPPLKAKFRFRPTEAIFLCGALMVWSCSICPLISRFMR